MLTQKYINSFLFLIIINKLLIKAHTAFKAMIKNTFDISFSCPCHVSMSGASSCVMF